MQRRREFLGRSALALGALATSARAAQAEGVTITFLHHNDTYEISPKKGMGGYAPFAALLKAERGRNPLTIATFGGDLISPSILSGLTQGAQMIELENAVGTELAVPGNHEFDFGPDVAQQRFTQSGFPWLGTNVLGRDGRPALGTHDWTIRDVGGFKIGFLGLLTPATAELSKPGPAITFAPVVSSAQQAVGQLRASGCDLIVALTHLDLAQDRELAAKVPQIDIILGGHDHEPMTFYDNDQLILKAGSDLHYLAAIDIRMERVEVKGRPVVAWRPAWRFIPTAGTAADPAVGTIVARWEQHLDAELSQEVGVTRVELDSRRGAVRTRETALGDLVADAIRNATGADLAIINGGGLRGDRVYAAGTVLTRKDVLTELPFGNVTVLTLLEGADIAAALENGVSKVKEEAGRFPQVSGLGFTWSPARPVGARVSDVKVDGRPLDPATTYKVATNDYMLDGGDGYASLARGKVLIDPSGGRLLASTVMSYITAKGGAVSPMVEGRIIEAS